MINLKARLNAVFNEIDKGSIVADIGCDHGKLSARLLQSGVASKVIAVDISSESLQKAKDLAQKLNLTNLITRVGDGLSVIEDNEVDTVVIAGMGGMEIIKILSNARYTYQKYVLVPHSNDKELRKYLMDKFLIQKDYLVKEHDKYYNVIVAVAGKSNLTDLEIEFGKNLDNPLLVELLTKRLKEYQSYIVSAEDKSELQSKIELIERVLKCVKQ